MATLYMIKKESEIVHTNTVEEVQPKNGVDFSLKELQGFVDGYIEVVYLNDEEIMVVNEEGRLLGLPINVAATLKYNEARGLNDLIVGNALVCKRSEVK